jgi:predicted secreted protein
VAQAPAIATFQTQAQTAGFSADGKYFMHLESWRDTGAGVPNAALQVVNLATNTCVTNGCLRTQFQESQASQSTAAAEQDLLSKTQPLRQDLNLTTPVAGIPLSIVSRSRGADGTESMTVRLRNNQPLQLTLKQQQIASVMSGGTAEKDQAAMQIEINYGGKTRSLGSLDKMHDWVQEFSIREVRQSPDGKAIAILVTAAERSFEGTVGKTIVQGFRLSPH